MLRDIDIEQQTQIQPISDIAAKLKLSNTEILPYGHDKAKIDTRILDQPRRREGTPKLVLVTAITPTSAGEGKTTTTIGLGQGLQALGESVCITLREPSLGPCMGVKGGATGGGYSQVIPSGTINLHFTGDFHGITAAHNLLAAAIDNHLHHGNTLKINPKRILWPRVIDMNDRSLRQIMVGMGAKNGTIRETSFDITAASEIMAILCLSTSLADLQNRLNRIVIAYSHERKPVRAEQLKVTGAMLALLKDALQPNLVQTLEGTPTLIHGGPFANIAHGCNSVLATKVAMHLADWTITEAGFGCDLGAEKFFDIKCVEANLDVCAVVVVATVRALKMHGGVPTSDLSTENVAALKEGICNLDKHLETIRHFKKHPIVAINRFHSDTDAELEFIRSHCEANGYTVALADHFAKGGQGAIELAEKVIQIANDQTKQKPLQPLYQRSDSIAQKIESVAVKSYGADGVTFEPRASADIKRLGKQGFGQLPICIAKTQSSLSDNPKRKGRPRNFNITVRRVLLNAGSGFLVVLTGDIMRMPGLPKKMAAEEIDVIDGKIVGIG